MKNAQQAAANSHVEREAAYWPPAMTESSAVGGGGGGIPAAVVMTTAAANADSEVWSIFKHLDSNFTCGKATKFNKCYTGYRIL